MTTLGVLLDAIDVQERHVKRHFELEDIGSQDFDVWKLAAELRSLDALSSIPEQGVGVKPVDETLVDVCLAIANDITEKLRGKEFRHGPVAHEIATFIYNCATKGGLAFYVAPSHPAAVAVTDEMVRAADYLIERLYNVSKGIPVRDLDEAWAAYYSAKAALVDRDRVK